MADKLVGYISNDVFLKNIKKIFLKSRRQHVKLIKEAYEIGRREVNMDKEILIITKKGKSCRIKISDWPTQLRGGVGIQAMMLGKGDEIVSVILL